MSASEREDDAQDSPVGWDAAAYDAKHAYVSRLGEDLVEVLAPRPGERVLDLGCGTGHLTARIASLGAVVIGIDSSPTMIDRARANYPELDFRLADAANFELDEPVDAVFSNAAIHWVEAASQDAVAACISRALRAGGRFVAELGGKGNVSTILSALRAALESIGDSSLKLERDPWFFPTIGEYAGILERHSLAVIEAHLFDRPTPLESGEDGMRDWIDMFASSWLASMPAPIKASVIAVAERRLRASLYHDGQWTADYRRLRLVALRER